MMYFLMPGSGTRSQWQAQEPPQAVPDDVLAVAPEDDSEDAEAAEPLDEAPDGVPDDVAPSAPAAGAAAAVEPLRKSVAYQPDPFNWKPAAVTCFEKLSAPQAGQTLSGASDRFCSTSLAWPQASQR
jgi:hypothetical protein